jgi:hypothetical protein
MTAVAITYTAEQSGDVQLRAVQTDRQTGLVDTPTWKRRLARAVQTFGVAMLMSEPQAYGFYLMSEAGAATEID